MGLHVTSVAEISGVGDLPNIKYFVYFLVLQLHICAVFSMCNGSGSLVLAPPS